MYKLLTKLPESIRTWEGHHKLLCLVCCGRCCQSLCHKASSLPIMFQPHQLGRGFLPLSLLLRMLIKLMQHLSFPVSDITQNQLTNQAGGEAPQPGDNSTVQPAAAVVLACPGANQEQQLADIGAPQPAPAAAPARRTRKPLQPESVRRGSRRAAVDGGAQGGRQRTVGLKEGGSGRWGLFQLTRHHL